MSHLKYKCHNKLTNSNHKKLINVVKCIHASGFLQSIISKNNIIASKEIVTSFFQRQNIGCCGMPESELSTRICFEYLHELTKIQKHIIVKIYCSDVTCLQKYFSEKRFQNNTLSINKRCLENDIFDPKINIHYISFACSFSNNPVIIQLLLDYFQIDIKDVTTRNYLYHDNMDCLAYACAFNTNLSIVKYLIEKCEMNVNKVSSVKRNCLSYAYNKYIYETKHYDIIKYLITETDIIDLSPLKDISLLKEIVPSIKNKEKLNYILEHMISKDWKIFQNDNEKKFIIAINPLLLNTKFLEIIDFDQNKITFDRWIKFTDELYYIDFLQKYVPKFTTFNHLKLSNNLKLYESMNIFSDKHQISMDEVLFEHNHKIYIGNRVIMYNSMLLFQNIVDHINFENKSDSKDEELIILEGSLP